MSRAKSAPADGLTKFQRYRRGQINKGMKLLRVWVPDPEELHALVDLPAPIALKFR